MDVVILIASILGCCISICYEWTIFGVFSGIFAGLILGLWEGEE